MSSATLSVLHINTADNLGGGARSAYKIHSGLRELGAASRMLVRTRDTDDPDVGYVHGGHVGRRILDGVGREIVDRLGWQYLYYPSSFALQRHPWFRAADVLQLYNTHGGFFTHRALPALTRVRPAVWRLSDMWPLTGHCAYAHDCQRWETGCGSCPLLREYPPLPRDTTGRLWRIKDSAYRQSRLTLVATNSWMEGIVRRSPLLARFPVRRIPNGVDPRTFRPRPKPAAREALGIPVDAAVILFSAHVARTGTRKGGEYVVPALERVSTAQTEPLLLVMGEGAEDWPDNPRYPTVRIGFSRDDRRLATVYSAADVVIHPAVAENFPNGVLEAMACGTPAVAFDTGGVRDAVRHLATGYLARYRDPDDLARGVREILADASLRFRLGAEARRVVEAEYSSELQARRFLSLYTDVLALTRQAASTKRGSGG